MDLWIWCIHHTGHSEKGSFLSPSQPPWWAFGWLWGWLIPSRVSWKTAFREENWVFCVASLTGISMRREWQEKGVGLGSCRYNTIIVVSVLQVPLIQDQWEMIVNWELQGPASQPTTLFKWYCVPFVGQLGFQLKDGEISGMVLKYWVMPEKFC